MTGEPMTITDVQPRMFMCPLPKGFRWEVRLIQRLDSIHVDLIKRRNIGPLASECAVLNFSQTTTEQAAKQVIDRRYRMWQKFFRASYEKTPEWQKRADELRAALAHPGVNVKVIVEKVK